MLCLLCHKVQTCWHRLWWQKIALKSHGQLSRCASSVWDTRAETESTVYPQANKMIPQIKQMAKIFIFLLTKFYCLIKRNFSCSRCRCGVKASIKLIKHIHILESNYCLLFILTCLFCTRIQGGNFHLNQTRCVGGFFSVQLKPGSLAAAPFLAALT